MIGVFDSGSGGLTVLKAIRISMPSADIVYFGDIKNAPYGEKSNVELLSLTAHAINILKVHGAQYIVSACNSVSASVAAASFDAIPVSSDHLVEMINPTVTSFKGATARILLVATPATIRSGIYQKGFASMGTEIQTLAIPTLAAAIEFGEPEAELERIIEDAFSSIKPAHFDTLILACTHYPLAIDSFRRVLGDDIQLFNPATAVAARVKECFVPLEAGSGRTEFLITSDSSYFKARIDQMGFSHNSTVRVIE